MELHELPSQVTVLPAQFRRLAHLSELAGSAIGISQTGSVLHVNTGGRRFDVGPDGRIINNPSQERLC